MFNDIEVISLPEKVAIYIPSEFNSTIIDVQTKFNNNFKGSTTTKGVGTWNGAKGLEVEDIAIIYSNVPAITAEIIDFIVDIARDVKINCKQESVAIELNNKLFLF